MGTSSGQLGFWMEQQGAKVVGYDLNEKEKWDIVPYHNYDFDEQKNIKNIYPR